MGKSQVEETVQGSKSESVKKIIRKVHLKPAKVDEPKDDQIDNWQPMKIAEQQQIKKQEKKKQKQNLATTFLSCLPKPNCINEIEYIFQPKMQHRKLVKPAIKYTPTPEQIKWDIEDKSFLDVGFSKDEPEIKEKLVEIEEDGQLVDEIKWLNDEQENKQDDKTRVQGANGKKRDNNVGKMKEIDLTKSLQETWKSTNKQRVHDSTLDHLLEGRGQISLFVKEAMEKFDQQEQHENRKLKNNRMIKSRYGW